MDLRGVACPLNWAKAKVRLEQLERAEMLSLLVDDVRAVRDIPHAAEAEGYAVLEVTEVDRAWRIVIER